MLSQKELKEIFESFDLTEFNKIYQEQYVVYKFQEDIVRKEIKPHDDVMKNLTKLIEEEVVDVAKNMKVYLNDNHETEMEYNGFYYGLHSENEKGFYVCFIEPWTEYNLEYNVPRKTKRIFIIDWKDSDKISESVYTMMEEYIRLDEICSKIYSEWINRKYKLFNKKFDELLHKISNDLFFNDFSGSECYILTYIDKSGNPHEVSQAYKWIFKTYNSIER